MIGNVGERLWWIVSVGRWWLWRIGGVHGSERDVEGSDLLNSSRTRSRIRWWFVEELGGLSWIVGGRTMGNGCLKGMVMADGCVGVRRRSYSQISWRFGGSSWLMSLVSSRLWLYAKVWATERCKDRTKDVRVTGTCTHSPLRSAK
jgi:hypothetical protein